MLNTRFRWLLLVFAVAALVIPLSPVGAAQTVIVDFSNYAGGTPASALTEPNMTFSSTGGTASVIGSNLRLFLATGTIEVDLSIPASSVSFHYLIGGTCGNFGSIELFLNGTSVVNTPVGVCTNGPYSQNVMFDRLVLSTGASGIQAEFQGNMTFVFADAAAAPAENVQFQPGDDRINHAIEDRAAPAAIYCVPHGIQVRRIDPATGIGIDPPVINLFSEDIEAAGVPTGENLLLAENDGVALYRLTTGEFQVNILNANTYEYKWYIFAWDKCPVPSVWYHLAN